MIKRHVLVVGVNGSGKVPMANLISAGDESRPVQWLDCGVEVVAERRGEVGSGVEAGTDEWRSQSLSVSLRTHFDWR